MLEGPSLHSPSPSKEHHQEQNSRLFISNSRPRNPALRALSLFRLTGQTRSWQAYPWQMKRQATAITSASKQAALLNTRSWTLGSLQRRTRLAETNPQILSKGLEKNTKCPRYVHKHYLECSCISPLRSRQRMERERERGRKGGKWYPTPPSPLLFLGHLTDPGKKACQIPNSSQPSRNTPLDHIASMAASCLCAPSTSLIRRNVVVPHTKPTKP